MSLRSNGFSNSTHSRGSCSAQRSASVARLRKTCSAGGRRQRRRSTAQAMRFASSSSRSCQSVVPGRQRSRSSARRRRSCASNRTAPTPSQKSSASASCSLSSSGKLILRTAGRPALHSTASTSETLPFSNAGPSRSCHSAAHSAASRGRRSSHSRLGSDPQRAAESESPADLHLQTCAKTSDRPCDLTLTESHPLHPIPACRLRLERERGETRLGKTRTVGSSGGSASSPRDDGRGRRSLHPRDAL